MTGRQCPIGVDDRHPGSVDPAHQHRDPAHRFRQQPGVCRILDVRLDHGRIDTDPVQTEVPGLGCETEQHDIQLIDDAGPEAAREFADRGLVRHPGFETYPTKPSPRQRIVHLDTELFIAKLEPDFQEQ